MGNIFELAKELKAMPFEQVANLLEHSEYECRMGAICIMDFQARDKKTSPEMRKQLFDLYISRHEKIDTWDMVDRGAPHIVGSYLIDKPRDVLYELARSGNVHERRTAIVSTAYFIGRDQVDDTFAIAEILVNDPEDSTHKAVGSWIRTAGKVDPDRLRAFLDRHAATMPRVTLRYAIEKFSPVEREHYLGMKNRVSG